MKNFLQLVGKIILFVFLLSVLAFGVIGAANLLLG